MKEKDFFFQKIRGICIIAVVLIHATGNISNSETFILVLRQFINFPVAVFFFISGYFIKKELFIEKEYSKNFIFKRVSRILIPYLFWSFLSLILLQKFYGFNLKIILINLLTGQIVSIYYFVIVLIQLILITPILMLVIDNKIAKMILGLITPITLILFYIITLLFNIDIKFPYYALPFPIWILFYYYGILVGNDKELENTISKNIIKNVVFYILLLLISIVEAFILYFRFNLYSFAISQIKISSYLCTYFLINIFIWLKSNINKKRHRRSTLIGIGNYSFGIYLIHMFVLDIVIKIYNKLPNTIVPIYLITVTTITILICFLIIWLTKKIIGNKYAKLILGF